MPDNPDLIEQFEIELQLLITRMHSDGIKYDTVHFILNEATKTLGLQAHCEKWLDSFTISDENITGSLE